MSKPNLFGNAAMKGPKPPTSTSVVTKKETNKTVNTKVKGTNLSLEGLPSEQALYLQTQVGQFKFFNRTQLGVNSTRIGVANFADSPLYKAVPSTMVRKLNIILRTMSGEMPSDFKEYDIENKKYLEPDVKGIGKPIDPEKLNIEQIPQSFPSYNIYLGPYLGGRYEYGTSKPAYSDKIMTTQVNYFEQPPMKNSQAEAYLTDPLKTLMGNPQTYTEEQLNKALNLYQGPKKFNFNYTLSDKAMEIFEFLKRVYEKELEMLNDEEKKLPARLIPSKIANGITIYIDDSSLKSGELYDLATKLGSTTVLDLVEDADFGSYEIHYLPLSTLYYILNTILGENNWTVETSSEVTWNNNRIVRGYYVDKLGNFKYGQIVIPSTSDFGNSPADKEKTGQSKLTRTLITQVFDTLHGLTKKEKEKLDEDKKSIIETALGKAMESWRDHDTAKLLEQTDVKPIKRIADAQEDEFKKRYLDWKSDSIKMPETKETKETKEDFKGIEKSKNGVTIEEKD